MLQHFAEGGRSALEKKERLPDYGDISLKESNQDKVVRSSACSSARPSWYYSVTAPAAVEARSSRALGLFLGLSVVHVLGNLVCVHQLRMRAARAAAAAAAAAA